MSKKMPSCWLKRSIILYLSVVLLTIGSFPSEPFAMFLPSYEPDTARAEAQGDTSRDESLKTIQKTLESKILRQRLADLGLTPEQISSRISQLTDLQLHQIASKIDAIQTGGGDDPFGFIIGILVIAILVVVLLQMTGHKVIITR